MVKKKSLKIEKPSKSKRKLVTVIWEDAVALSNIDLEEVKTREQEIVETYGVLVKTKRYHIVMTHDSHGEYNDYLKIPSSLVRKVIVHGNIKEDKKC